MNNLTLSTPLRNLFNEQDQSFVNSHYLEPSKSQRIRTIGEWAEDEVIIPTGPYKDLKFKLDRQPIARLLYDEFSNPHWQEYAITGSTQTGKSFLGFALPVCWTLCERKEDVIIAAPTMEILEDKVKRDIYPILEASRYAYLIPTKGGGSKGGIPDRIDLTNGTVIKLMSFEGGDKSKASFTCPNLFFTEVDGSKAQTTSLEANPIEQIKGRARAAEREKRFIVYECTVSVEDGRIWQLTQVIGSGAKIMLKCVHCGEWSRPDREDIKGWQEAKSEIEAEDKTAWCCPLCDQPWTEKDRRHMNETAVLMHRGQEMKGDKVRGKLPETRTLGFRFAAVNNLFLPAKDVGVDCWNVMQDEDDLDGEKKLTQFVFCLPYVPPGLDMVKMKREEVEQRQLKYPKGSPPKETKWITIGCDVGKYDCYWTAICWLLPSRVGLVFDYGRIRLRIPHRDQPDKWMNATELGFDSVFSTCMDEWKSLIDTGWMNSDGEVYDYDALWMDARYQGDDPDVPVVYNSIKHWGDKRVLPIMGHASNHFTDKRYRPVTLRQKHVICVGHEYDIRFVPEIRLHRGHVNSDAWKTMVQRGFLRDPGSVGSLMLFNSNNPREHATYVKHIDSEYRNRHFDPEKGNVEEWINKREANHYLDATVYACAAGHRAGFRAAEKNERRKRSRKRRQAAVSGRDGRSFVATQR